MLPLVTDTLYEEAAYYRMLFRERSHDARFYLEACRGHERLLELGIGDGRMATALARAGHTVKGVDLAPAMLCALDERLRGEPDVVRERVDAVRGDARSVRLDETFARVIYPFNGMAHFHDRAAQAEVLATVAAHLAPEGRFVFDVMLPDPRLLEGGASSVPRLEHPRTGRVCRLEETYTFDRTRRVLTIETTLIDRLSSDRQTMSLRLRQFSDGETTQMLSRAGFSVVQRDDSLGDMVGWVCERA